jgi:hypothetical protein
MPQQLPVGIRETLEWEGVHIPFGLIEFKVTTDLRDKDISRLAHASKDGIVLGCVRLSSPAAHIMMLRNMGLTRVFIVNEVMSALMVTKK